MNKNLIAFLVFFVIFLSVVGQVACALSKVAKPQRGGSAQVSLAPSSPAMTINQPENSSTPTVAKFERKIVPITSINSNWFAIQEKYETELGSHQPDEARAGYAAVQKTAAVLRAQSPIMYVGLVLIVCSLAMSYFQAKFPTVFAPGLKVIALTFLTGLCLAVLPALVQNKTFLIFSLLAGLGIVFGYIYSKQFSGKTEKKENTQ